MGLGPSVATFMFDLSEAGTRFGVAAELPAGQQVKITFSAASLAKPIKRMAKVVRCGKRDDGGWWAAATFERRLDYAELQRLV
jgi:hypothetical protein